MKIGIITHYYKSTNYGGNLQAYALCKAINKLGHQAEQINFKYNVVSLIGDTSKKIEGNKIINFCKKVKEYIVYKTIYFLTIKK